MPLKHLITRYWPQLFLIIIWFALCVTNFKANSFLTGWDNLHPEFNPTSNILRSLSPSWQEYQGLGLTGGMGHAADLSRQLLIWFLSFMLPLALIRYVLVFGMLLVGTLGAATLIKKIIKEEKYHSLASLIAGSFYLLNLGTVQNFYVPFEPFYWYFGCLPWLLYFLFDYLEKPISKKLLLFFVVSLVSTPLGYLQTAFVTYISITSIFLTGHIFHTSFSSLKQRLVSVASIVLVIIITNAFWLFPVIYFTLTQAEVTMNAKINSIATPEVFFSNNAYGTFSNLALLKGYWFSLHDFKSQGKFEYLFQPWVNHIEQPGVEEIGYIFFCLVVIGLLFSTFQYKKYRYSLALVLTFALCLFMLAGENPPVGFVMSYLRSSFPLFNQIFRSAFTKWIVPTSLSCALLLSIGCVTLFRIISKLRIQFLLSFSVSCVILSALTYFSLPSFQGHYIYSQMRHSIPQEYFSLFEYYRNQPTQIRTAFLPMHSLWGWNFYDWGYRGSGFLWYGIDQPIIDRAFDVWSPHNETFYQQATRALSHNDAAQFKKILSIYGITHLLVDRHVITTSQKNDINYDAIEKVIKESGFITDWQQGSLSVYTLPTTSYSYLQFPQQYTSVATNDLYTRTHLSEYLDTPYLNINNPLHIFPFLDVTAEEIDTITYSNNGLEIKRTLPVLDNEYDLLLPSYKKGESIVTSGIFLYDGNSLILSFPPSDLIVVGEEKYPLPSLPEFKVPVYLNKEKIIIQSGNTQFEVTKNTPKLNTLELVIGQENIITVIDPLIIKQIGEVKTVDPEDTFELKINEEVWKPFLSASSISLPASTTTITYASSQLPYEVPLQNIHTQDCDILNRGESQTSFITTNGSMQLSAKAEGARCAGVLLDFLSTHNQYLVRVRGENRQGRSIKLNITNETNKRQDLEALLPAGPFDSSFSLLSWPNLENAAYSLNWEVKSFGQPSDNILSSIFVYELPLEKLSSLNLRLKNSDSIKNTVTNVNSNWKFATYQYGAEVTVSDKPGLITLSQAYDEGWIALAFSTTQQTLPTLFSHYRYNGWSNGWEVPAGDWKITIIYWPQLLSFAGYGLLIFSIAWSLFRFRHKRK